ncbi:unnamed protein product [Ixodes persulcatus]
MLYMQKEHTLPWWRRHRPSPRARDGPSPSPKGCAGADREPGAPAGGGRGPREEERWGRSLRVGDEQGPDACRRHLATQLHRGTTSSSRIGQYCFSETLLTVESLGDGIFYHFGSKEPLAAVKGIRRAARTLSGDSPIWALWTPHLAGYSHVLLQSNPGSCS